MQLLLLLWNLTWEIYIFYYYLVYENYTTVLQNVKAQNYFFQTQKKELRIAIFLIFFKS
jgi:hypothetical protein